MKASSTVRGWRADRRREVLRIAAGLAAGSMAIANDAAASVAYLVDSNADGVDDNTADDVCHTAAGTCTLRAAIMQANHGTDPAIAITLPAGVYQLTLQAAGSDADDSGDLNLTPPASGNPVVSIVGAGAAVTIIDAGTVGRVLRINAGRSAVLAGIMLRNGSTLEPEYGEGGGVANFGTLAVDHCVFLGNKALGLSGVGAGPGGAIFNYGTLSVVASTIRDNSSSGQGAGIYNAAGASADIRRSTLSGNVAQSTGGGISNYGTLYVSDSTISTNTARVQSGGIDNLGTGNVYNSTIVFNQSDVDGTFGGSGGGVFNGFPGVLNLRNSILAGNFRPTPFTYDDCSGDLGSYGNNRFFALPLDCTVTQKSAGSKSLLATLAELGPLQDNGGPTRTHALLFPSGMIDGTEPTLGCVDQASNALDIDQRGFARSIGARCDIGAFEYDPDIIFLNGYD